MVHGCGNGCGDGLVMVVEKGKLVPDKRDHSPLEKKLVTSKPNNES